MIKPAEEEHVVNKVVGGEGGGDAVGLNEFFRVNLFVQPVAGESEKVPGDDEPKKNSKLRPTGAAAAAATSPEQQAHHGGYEQQVADLVGNESFCAAMGLDGAS
ncbi:MAG: hypothetical protein KKB30_15420 [Proteobacteria bacterium]|nr:hypothetical protein [Pseudomonadota bacterium]MBU1716314.1 hypothetical protein [Pseudomonadota bacterium]